MSTTVKRTDTDRVLVEVTDGYSVSAAPASIIVMLPDPVGLAEKLVDALTDDERAGLLAYLSPQTEARAEAVSRCGDGGYPGATCSCVKRLGHAADEWHECKHGVTWSAS